jgi:hypothetical protein
MKKAPKKHHDVYKLIPYCLAPKCRKVHTGPRFHFLCEKHRDIIDRATAVKLVKAAKAARAAK